MKVRNYSINGNIIIITLRCFNKITVVKDNDKEAEFWAKNNLKML